MVLALCSSWQIRCSPDQTLLAGSCTPLHPAAPPSAAMKSFSYVLCTAVILIFSSVLMNLTGYLLMTVVLEAAADIQLADTIPPGRGLGTRSPPTDHTHLPIHQSVSSADDG